MSSKADDVDSSASDNELEICWSYHNYHLQGEQGHSTGMAWICKSSWSAETSNNTTRPGANYRSDAPPPVAKSGGATPLLLIIRRSSRPSIHPCYGNGGRLDTVTISIGDPTEYLLTAKPVKDCRKGPKSSKNAPGPEPEESGRALANEEEWRDI